MDVLRYMYCMEYSVIYRFSLKVVVADFVGKYFGGVMNCLCTILYVLLKLWFINATIAAHTHYTVVEEMASGAP